MQPVQGLDAVHERLKELAVFDEDSTLSAFRLLNAGIDKEVRVLHAQMGVSADNQVYKAGMVAGLHLAQEIPARIKKELGGKLHASAEALKEQEAEQARIAALNDEP